MSEATGPRHTKPFEHSWDAYHWLLFDRGALTVETDEYNSPAYRLDGDDAKKLYEAMKAYYERD